MAYTGTTSQVWVRVCETYVAPGPASDCGWIQVYRTVFDVSTFDLYQLEMLFGAIIMLVVLVFIIGQCKRAIEQ